MGITDINVFKGAIKEALAAAESIANEAKANPTAFIQPKIGEWQSKYAQSRYAYFYNEPGMFDNFDRGCLIDLSNKMGFEVNPINYVELQAVAQGDPKGSAAVFGQIALIRSILSDANVDKFYAMYEQAISSKNAVDAFTAFNNCWRAALIQINILLNTMLRNMEQGEKPKPVCPPGYHVIHTPMGQDYFAPDSPVDTMKAGEISVPQLRQIIQEELAKKNG